MQHGSTGGEVTLDGRRVRVPRSRTRSVDGEEIELATYRHFACRTDRDPRTVRLARKALRVFIAAFDEPLDPTTPVEVVALNQQEDTVGRLARPAGR